MRGGNGVLGWAVELREKGACLLGKKGEFETFYSIWMSFNGIAHRN